MGVETGSGRCRMSSRAHERGNRCRCARRRMSPAHERANRCMCTHCRLSCQRQRATAETYTSYFLELSRRVASISHIHRHVGRRESVGPCARPVCSSSCRPTPPQARTTVRMPVPVRAHTLCTRGSPTVSLPARGLNNGRTRCTDATAQIQLSYTTAQPPALHTRPRGVHLHCILTSFSM